MKKNLLTTILYILILALILSLIFIYYFEKKLGKELIRCAENRVKQLSITVINNNDRRLVV